MATEFPYLEGVFGPEEIQQRIPFLIRGHHLRHLSIIFHGYGGKTDPNESAELYSHTQLSLYQSLLNDRLHYYTPEELYMAEDTVGTTLEQQRAYKQKLQTFYQLFLALPDDYPVNLVTGQKDFECSACAYGKHCEMLDHPSGDVNELDWDNIRPFLTFTQNHPEYVIGNIERTIARKRFPDNYLETSILTVSTTVGTVKNYLRH